jgi:hypothetical protein
MAWAEQPGAASVDSSSRRVPFRHFLGDPTRAWRMAAMVTVVVAASLFALSRWTPSPGNETSRIVAPPPSAVPALPDKPGSEPQTRVPPATLLLDANAVRGSGSMPTLVFDANAEVRLQLALETAGYPSYRVVVRTVAGEEIWRREGVTVIQSPSGPTLTITVPANRLADDDYTVRVGAISATGEVDEVSGYTFRAQAGR